MESVVDAVQTQHTNESVAQPQNPVDNVDSGNEGLIRKNRELLDEKKKLQNRFLELENELKNIKDEKLLEKEEFKKLYEQEKEKVNDLMAHKGYKDKYDNYFNKLLEDELKTVPESIKKIISESNKPLDERLDDLKSIKIEMGKSVNSPASERPSGNIDSININDYIGSQNMQKLLDLSYDNPELYKEIQKKINERS